MDKIIEKKRGLQKKHIPYIAVAAGALFLLLWILFGNHQSTMLVEQEAITVSNVIKGEFKD